MKEAQPDIEFVAEQAPPWARSTPVRWCRRWPMPSLMPSSTCCSRWTWASLCAKATPVACSEGREVVGLLTAEPEYLDACARSAKSWADGHRLPLGTPSKTPAHAAFLKAYQAKFKDYPRLGTIVGYNAIQSLLQACARPRRATRHRTLIAAFKGLEREHALVGPITYPCAGQPVHHGRVCGQTAYDSKLAAAYWPTTTMPTARTLSHRRVSEKAASGGCQLSTALRYEPALSGPVDIRVTALRR